MSRNDSSGGIAGGSGAKTKRFSLARFQDGDDREGLTGAAGTGAEMSPLIKGSVRRRGENAEISMHVPSKDGVSISEEKRREVRNMKYWINKISLMFRRVRHPKKRRESSLDSVNSSFDGEFDDSEEVVRCTPEAIDTLCQVTKFNKRELQLMYRGFKQECPSGMVKEETFKGIYAQYFPRGSDVTQYAHYVFNTFDQEHTGAITFTDFVIGLSALARGSLQDKLRWVFNLYDINGDGCITKEELSRMVGSVYDLMGRSVEPIIEEHTTRDHVDKVFQKLDLNRDGIVTIDEFMDSCSKDDSITKAMNFFNTIL